MINMDTFFTFLLLVGIFCTVLSVIYIHNTANVNTNKSKKKKPLLKFAFLSVSILIMLTGIFCNLFFLPRGSLHEDFSPTIEEAVTEFSPPFTDYVIFDQIETDINPTPITMGYEAPPESTSEDGVTNITLIIYAIKTEEYMGHTGYFIDRGFRLVDTWIESNGEVTELINENYVYEEETFPNIWFGVIYPDKKDKIQINGNKPEFYDFQFLGTDYVFWYIARDGGEPILSFEE